MGILLFEKTSFVFVFQSSFFVRFVTVNKLALFDCSQLLFKICVLLFDKARFEFRYNRFWKVESILGEISRFLFFN